MRFPRTQRYSRRANIPLPYRLSEVWLRAFLRSFWLFEIAEVVKISEEFFLFFENVNDV